MKPRTSGPTEHAAEPRRHDSSATGEPKGQVVQRRIKQRADAATHLRGRWREHLHSDRVRRKLVSVVVVLLLVGIPLVLFSLVGLPHLFRKPFVREVVARRTGEQPLTIGSAQFAQALTLLTGSALTRSNAVEVLANGDGTFPFLWKDLRSAKRSITVQMYYAGPGAIADSVTRILAERARTGVDVYFLYDAFGAQQLPQRYLDTLRAVGARVAELRPVRWYALDRASHRSHVRGIIVDGTIAYTGGFGFDDKWLGGGRRRGEWRETNARFVGPAVAALQAAFIATWAEATGELLTAERLLSLGDTRAATSAGVAGATAAALINSPPVTGSTTAERLVALSIASAQQRLYVANAYFIPDGSFVKFLADAARRGVDVRILTNGPQSDVKSTWLAGRSRYVALLTAGVRIYEYRPTTMHAKTFVVDGAWSAVSTMNFDNRSLAYNNEVALVTLDNAVGAAMEKLFLDDLRFADEIRLDAFRRRPRTQRLLERAASILASVL